MAAPIPPSGGLPRWAYYARHVMRRGVPFLWALCSFVAGFGIVAALVAFAGLAATWLVTTVFAGLFIVAGVGGYCLWSDIERQIAKQDTATGIAKRQIAAAVRAGRSATDVEAFELEWSIAAHELVTETLGELEATLGSPSVEGSNRLCRLETLASQLADDKLLTPSRSWSHHDQAMRTILSGLLMSLRAGEAVRATFFGDAAVDAATATQSVVSWRDEVYRVLEPAPSLRLTLSVMVPDVAGARYEDCSEELGEILLPLDIWIREVDQRIVGPLIKYVAALGQPSEDAQNQSPTP
jgi:hypothetical protein